MKSILIFLVVISVLSLRTIAFAETVPRPVDASATGNVQGKKLEPLKGISPKLFQSLSKLIPSDVWIQEVKVDNTNLYVQGSAPSTTQIIDLMKNLSDKSEFTTVKLVDSGVAKDQSGVESTHFKISASRQ